MNWFYWKAHHGLPYDTKIALISKRLNIHRTRVLSVWIACLDFASQHAERGSVAGIDPCEIALGLDLPTEEVEAILQAFRFRGMIVADGITAWEKRNEKSEDRTAAERKRRQREREKSQCHAGHAVTGRDCHGQDSVTVTVERRDCHAEERRGEEIREAASVAVPVVEPPPSAAALQQRVRSISETKGMRRARSSAQDIEDFRNWLKAYPEAGRLPGEPDDDIVQQCLTLANGDLKRATQTLCRMNEAGKRPNHSWAYFPKVMRQYLGAVSA